MSNVKVKKRKRSTAMVLLLGLALLFSAMTGCISANAATEDLMKDVSPAPSASDTEISEDAVFAVSSFGMELFRQCYATGEKNTLVSPLSVMLALGMTANGADGRTLEQFEETLGGGMSIGQLNETYFSLMKSLTDTRGSTVLNIAEAIWLNEGFEPRDAFLQANADFYGAAAYRMNFSEAETLEKINGFVNEKTEGLIPEIIDELDPQDIMVLLNTVYLNAVWQTQFSANDNIDGVFTDSEGKPVDATYMSNGIRGEKYIHNDGASGVLLPYDDGRLGYLAVMPDPGMSMEDFVAGLSQDKIASWMDSARQTQILLQLPKYEARYDITLNDVLDGMGISDAFSELSADFGRMGSVEGGNIFIGRVLHKTCIQVNEKGTEAAAATSVEMEPTGAPADDYVNLRFDRPFVYAVVDLETGLPLFIGLLDSPAQG